MMSAPARPAAVVNPVALNIPPSHPPTPVPAVLKLNGIMWGNRPVAIIVMFGQSVQPLLADAHLSLVDLDRPNAVSFYARTQQRMLSQIGSAGLEAETMASYNATPIATYGRINAATIRVEAGRAFQDALREVLTANAELLVLWRKQQPPR